jgi:hypothetical protein
MGLITMKVERDGHHRHVHPQERHEHVTQATQVRQAVKMGIQEIEHFGPTSGERAHEYS